MSSVRDKAKSSDHLPPALPMEAFKSLWRPRGQIAIPQYRQGSSEDNVDLQVKALYYMFRRLDIAHGSLHPKPSDLAELDPEDREQLDKMYNLNGFKHVIATDPHRVLVDWVKNRFRAMLILSHHPQMIELPQFDSPLFHFCVLEADASADEYVRTLSRSEIFVEHPLPTEVRQNIAMALVSRFPQRTKDARAKIIMGYLHQVGIEIQVARIYKATLSKVPMPATKVHPRSQSPESRETRGRQHISLRQGAGQPTPGPTPRLSSPPPNQQRIRLSPKGTSSPPRSPPRSPHFGSSHSPSNSPSHSPSHSPTRPLRLRTSNTNLRLNADKNPSLKPTAGTKAVMPDDGRKQLLQQARLAVRARVEREHEAIMRVATFI